MKSKRLSLGSYTFAMALLALAAVIVINLIASALPSASTEFDISSSGMFTLDPQTKKILSELDEDITVYFYAQTSQIDSAILQLLRRYTDLSEHVKLEYVDPVLEPNFIKEYTKEAINQNSLIVESSKRFKIVDYMDIYTITGEEALYYWNYYGEYYPDTFSGENALTGAVNYVVTDSLPAAVQLSGHGEIPLPDALLSEIEHDNITLSTVELLKSGLPADTRLVIINSPMTDISSAELEILKDYLSKGNKIMLFTDIRTDDTDFTNLDKLCEGYEMSFDNGVLTETDAANYYYYNFYFYPEITSHDISAPLLENKFSVYLTGSHGISYSEDSTKIKHTELLCGSESSFLQKNISSKETKPVDGDKLGPIPCGVLAERASDSSALLWFASSSLTDQSVNLLSNYANYSLVLNSAQWLCGKTDTISLRTAALETEYLSLSQADSILWTSIICVVLPLSFPTVGFLVWNKRRKA